MPRGKGIHDDENADEAEGGPHPREPGQDGGTAGREVGSEVTTADDAPEPPD